MSLVTQIQALAVRIAGEIRDVVKPKLVPSGGLLGEVLSKSSNSDHLLVWAALHGVARTGSYTDLEDRPTLFSGSYGDLDGLPDLQPLATASTPPSTPSQGQEWVDADTGILFKFYGTAWVEFGPAPTASSGGGGEGGGSGYTIRYIGDEAPDTSDWEVDELWLDTSTEI